MHKPKTLIGIVSDTLNVPLENANVIAKPFGANAQLKFAIACKKQPTTSQSNHNEKPR